MKSEAKDLLRGELIGQILEIPLTGTKGKIINETKYCFEILTINNHRKKIIKNQKLIFSLEREKIEVDGEKIEMKPEDRLKKIKW